MVKLTGRALVVKRPGGGAFVRTKSALRKTGPFLTKAESLGVGAFSHREIKGRFRKRVVLANVPSFRFSFRGNMRTYPRSGFSFRGNIRTYPRNGFSFRGNIRQNHPFGIGKFRTGSVQTGSE